MKNFCASALLLGVTLLFPLSAPSQQRGGQTGVFDYYLLNLSWSPEFCHSSPNNVECGGRKHFGFIVHGLWPEFRNGGGPEYCAPKPGPSNPSAMLDIMPDLHLIEHEWTTHGTCSGLSADEYFSLIRKIYSAIRIPPPFLAPQRQLNSSPQEIKRAFEQTNPGLSDAGIAISCSGQYLKAIEFCVTKDGKPIPCTAVRDCRINVLRVPPVR